MVVLFNRTELFVLVCTVLYFENSCLTQAKQQVGHSIHVLFKLNSAVSELMYPNKLDLTLSPAVRESLALISLLSNTIKSIRHN